MRAAAAVLLAAAALAGCGAEDEEDDEAAPAAAPEPVDCGSYESLNRPPTAQQRAQNRCLLDAREAGRPARLRFTLATVEGDPLVHHLAVTDSGQVEVLVDATEDSFGPGGWQAYTCTGLAEDAGRLVWTGCAETEAPATPPTTD